MAVVGDNFNRANSADLGANWDLQNGFGTNLQIASNTVEPGAAATSGAENYNAVTFGNDQFSQAKIAAFNTAQDIRFRVTVRASTVAQTYYFASAERTGGTLTTKITKVVAAAETDLATENATTWAVGDILKLEIVGGVLKAYRNGRLLLTGVDTAIDSGRIGIYVDPGAGGVTDVALDDFLGGDVAVLIDYTQFPKPPIFEAALRGEM